MYFNAETQARILTRFHFALADPGVLFLGKAEMLLSHANLFQPVDLKRRVFARSPAPTPLETAYEELQSTNEELETTNEELQSTVEVLETTNEELQSTNEELETMNEELHSTNDELQNINEQLRDRTADLDSANAFLEAILTSLQAGVAVLDRDLRIQVWNRRAEDLWGLRQRRGARPAPPQPRHWTADRQAAPTDQECPQRRQAAGRGPPRRGQLAAGRCRSGWSAPPLSGIDGAGAILSMEPEGELA